MTCFTFSNYTVVYRNVFKNSILWFYYNIILYGVPWVKRSALSKCMSICQFVAMSVGRADTFKYCTNYLFKIHKHLHFKLQRTRFIKNLQYCFIKLHNISPKTLMKMYIYFNALERCLTISKTQINPWICLTVGNGLFIQTNSKLD